MNAAIGRETEDYTEAEVESESSVEPEAGPHAQAGAESNSACGPEFQPDDGFKCEPTYEMELAGIYKRYHLTMFEAFAGVSTKAGERLWHEPPILTHLLLSMRTTMTFRSYFKGIATPPI